MLPAHFPRLSLADRIRLFRIGGIPGSIRAFLASPGQKSAGRPALQQIPSVKNKGVGILMKMPACYIQPGLPGRCEQPAMNITGKKNPKCLFFHNFYVCRNSFMISPRISRNSWSVLPLGNGSSTGTIFRTTPGFFPIITTRLLRKIASSISWVTMIIVV